MHSPRVSIGGFTTVLVLPQTGASSGVGTGGIPETSLKSGNHRDVMVGPGVAMLSGLLARLGIACTAHLERGRDASGILLRELIENIGPTLHPQWHPSPSGDTVTMALGNGPDRQPTLTSAFRGSDFRDKGLHACEPAPRTIRVWCYPASAIGCSRRNEAEFASGMAAARGCGTTQVLLLGSPFTQREGDEPWQDWLRPLLAHTDLLCAQADALVEILDPEAALELSRAGTFRELPCWLTGGILHSMSGYLLDCGVGVVVIGLGDHGVYLRSNQESSRVTFVRKFAPDDRVAAHLANWTERDILIPPFEFEAANRYSSSDAMCAGMIASLLHGLAPEEAIRMTAAIMGFAGEAADPVQSMVAWDAVQARVDDGWPQGRCRIDLSGWSGDGGS